MVDPDEMSLASEDDDAASALGAEDDGAELHPDSDGDDEADDDPPDSENDGDSAAPLGGTEEDEDSADAIPQADKDDEDDEDAIPQPDSDDEEEKQKEREKAAAEDAQKKAKREAKGIMKHFQVKQQGASSEKGATPAGSSKAAPAPKPAAAASRPKGGKAAAAAAATSAQPVAVGQNGAAKGAKAKVPAAASKKSKEAAKPPVAKSSEAKQPESQADFTFQDSEEEVEITMPRNKGVPLTAPPDPVQEYDDMHKGGGESARAASNASNAQDAPQVSELAKKRRYVIKNEKTKRWAEWLPKGLLFAPECADLFDLALDDLTIPSRKERIASQTKLADEEMDKIMQTLVMGSYTADAAGSGSGPGITNVMGAIPSTVPLQDKEHADLLSRLKARDASEGEVVLLHMLDHDIMKRVYKVSNAPLPAKYNPNTNPSNKFKVASQVEKAKENDDNFVDLGIIEINKKQRAAKRSTEERPNGHKPEGKRPANGSAAAPSNAEAEKSGAHSEYEEDTLSICGNPTLMKVFTSKDFATSYAELRCKEDQKFTVCQAGPGKFILLLGPV